MARRSAKLTNRAWRLLQLRFLETLELWHSRQSPRLQFEKEFSFEKTRSFRFKTLSLRFLPCITPSVNHDFDRDEADLFFYQREKENEQIEYNSRKEGFVELIEEGERLEERGIDTKAEEFISRFHEEMKLQRQVSAIQYYEMLERSA